MPEPARRPSPRSGAARRPSPFPDPTRPRPTRAAIRVGLLALGLAVAGLVVLAAGAAIVGIVLLVVAAGDGVWAAYLALRDPYEPPVREEDL